MMDRDKVQKACEMARGLAEFAREHQIERAIFGDVAILDAFERRIILNVRAGKRPTGTC